MLLELLVLDQRHVRRQHHEGLGRAVGELSGTAPLPPGPLLVKEQLEVVVGESGRGEGPRAIEAGSVCHSAKGRTEEFSWIYISVES